MFLINSHRLHTKGPLPHTSDIIRAELLHRLAPHHILAEWVPRASLGPNAALISAPAQNLRPVSEPAHNVSYEVFELRAGHEPDGG